MRHLVWLSRWVVWLSAVITFAITHPALDTAAVCAVGAALFTGTSVVLAGRSGHPEWPRVQRRAVCVEAGSSGALAMWMVLHGSLDLRLVLIVWTAPWTYAWICSGDGIQGVLEALASAVIAAGVAVTAWRGAPSAETLWRNLPYLALCGLAIACARAGQTLRRERALHRAALDEVRKRTDQLARYSEQVNAYAERVHRLAAAEERNRIAGVIHDTVAHRLTALFVQLQAARRVLAQGEAAAAVENLEVCQELARESLADVRQSVHALRSQAAGEGVAALRRLAVQYGTLTGMDVRFDAGGVEVLPVHCLGVLYRAIQEGLTNAHRHGRASAVTVRLQAAGGMVTLEVSDNGRGAHGALAGFGLTTMRERAQRLGGDVQVDTRPGQGFRLRVQVPAWEGTGA